MKSTFKSNLAKLAASAALAVGVCFTAPSMAQDVTVLKFASFVSPKSINNRVTVPAFIKAVEEASEGTLKIEHYPGGTLGSNPATQLKLVEDGVVDIAEIVAAYTPGRFKELELFELPFVFDNSREAGLTAQKMYDKGLLTGFDKFELMGIIEVGPYTMHANKEIASPSDIKGKKIRAGGPTQVDIIKRMGGIPIGGISATKIAENISRRVLDGSLMDDGNLINFRIADAVKNHIINVPLGNVAVIFPMNKAKYDALPAKAKAALDKYRGTWFTDMLNTNLDKQIEEARAKLSKDSKHNVGKWSDEQLDEVRGKMSGIEAKWDTKNDAGVNLYREMLTLRDEVRAAK
ncbi:MAG: TRAP transporter substrate-binding protein DctP [Cohaesibacter sp.]|nr:TRAP transporter substrate-binding protein DctP [Cohaesibacter sp.]